MTARQQRRHERYLDCDTPVAGNFCSHCGQENSDYRVSLKRLLGDLFEELFQLESRLWRSLYHLFRHPGQLTVDYNAGRRVRYTSPLRLYLIASVAYFFFVALLPPTAGNIKIDFDEGELVNGALGAPNSDLDRFIRGRMGLKQGMQMADVERHTTQVLAVNAPKVLAVLVPLFALLTMAFFRKPKLFFVEHLVLALHLHAVAFWTLLASELTRVRYASMVALAGVTIWALLALHALFHQRWWRTILKGSIVGAIYLIFVGVGIFAALML